MEGRRDTTLNGERPIMKPRYPLPQDFGRRKEDPGLSIEEVALKDQRAHFYRKDTTGSGAAVYDFIITAENNSAESH